MTPSGMEPATFRFVTQHLNHCATVVPTKRNMEERKIHPIRLYAEQNNTKVKAQENNFYTEKTKEKGDQ